MSDTPRTEARLNSDVQFHDEVVGADFARELERELNRALRVVKAAQGYKRCWSHEEREAIHALFESVEEWESGR